MEKENHHMRIQPRKRRCGALVAAVLSSALVLTACGSDSDSGDEESGPLMPAAEGATQYPLTLDTWLGKTVLDERPERIAVVGDGSSPNIDALELLDVSPVYAQVRPDIDYLWNEAEWLDDEDIVDERDLEAGPNLERIAASEPDLIIGVDLGHSFEDSFAELAEIAPVLEGEKQVKWDQVDWRERHTLIGEALDLGEAAKEDVEEADQAIDEIAAEHPEFEGRTITLAYDYGEKYGVSYYTVAGGTAEGIVTKLGFDTNPLSKGFVDEDVVSEENMADLDADVLLMFYTDEATRKAREKKALFTQIPAVSQGRYVPVVGEVDDRAEGGAIWAMRGGMSPLSLPWTSEVIAEWANEADVSG